MANSALDDLAQQGQRDGRNIISVQWGAWDLGGEGMAKNDALRRVKESNLGVVTKQLGLQTLQTIMETSSLPPVIMVSPMTEADEQTTNENQEKWLSMDDRQNKIKEFLMKTVEHVTGETIEPTDSIMEAGLDSLSAVEFRNAIQKEFNIIVQPSIFQDEATIESIMNEIETQLSSIVPKTIKESETKSNTQKDIHVVGFNCKFANVDNLDEFWNTIQTKQSLIQENAFPRFEKESCKYHSSLLSDIDQFDYKHFNMTKEQASMMDPQHRLVMESIEEAIVDASMDAPFNIHAGQCNVYLAIAHNEYQHYHKTTNPMTMSSLSHSMLGLRIKKHFKITGTYQHVDTACSSSLVALHQAVQDLHDNKCQTAIVSGVNLTMLPKSYKGFESMEVFSHDGIVRSFTEDGTGYARSEGVGTIILTNRNVKDRYCTIVSTAMTQNTPSMEVIFTPDWDAQRDLHLQLTKNIDKVDFLEVHGTGTAAGDLIEAYALLDAYDNNTPQLGCCKQIWGHNEVASGMMEFAKMLCVLNHQTVPGNLNADTINEAIPEGFNYSNKDINMEVNVAGCHSFGFSGTNAGVIVKKGNRWFSGKSVNWNKERCWC